jgi:glyoxylase-like metal-dependent hydrolase (beta-lactamase superfamily II)
MTLQINSFTLGPIGNNAYLIHDDETRQALLIDAPLEPGAIAEFIEKNDLLLEDILITHGHFDHYYGLPFLLSRFSSVKEVYLHPDDLDLWNSGGGAKHFWGKSIPVTQPTHLLAPGETIKLGVHEFTFRHAPGHSAGSVIYYSAEMQSAFVGDVIFLQGIGRTDLDGGDFNQLIHSIQTQVFTLPEQTTLYPGHGPATTVKDEKLNNPYF